MANPEFFLRTMKIRIITFGKYVRTFKCEQLPLKNIYEPLNRGRLKKVGSRADQIGTCKMKMKLEMEIRVEIHQL